MIAGVFFFMTLAGCSEQTSSGVADGSRWQPASDDTIVYALPGDTGEGASLYELRRELSRNSADPAIAARYATVALKNYAQSGDPRLLGYARGALQRWQAVAAPPPAIWLLRGRLTQTEHRFEAAGMDMDRLLALHPDKPEALLLAADAWRRAGNLSAARGRCLTLSLAGFPELARLCAADVQLSSGQPQLALNTAAATIENYGAELDDEILSWAHAIHAEAATASGAVESALDSWDLALTATSQPTLALQIGRVDTLLEAQRYEAVLQALEPLPAADAVVLRRAIAGNALQHADLDAWRDELLVRFDDPAYTADDSLHWRERALFELDVMQQPQAALRAAQRNWAIQKGFED
ncbi:MAG: hypothetical protein HKP32_01920, partial [Woeseia sp.]|nr:hypothetical protein [Woeseia sp.]NNL53892.1 hypothetical protein [Woeseia sp.]